MSTKQFLQFLFETSQVDAETEALLRETEDTERMALRKTPLLKALKKLGIPTENVTVDADGAKLTIGDAALWHEIVRKLGNVDTMNALADEGWVPEFAGDIADTTELPEYTLNFLPLHDAEPSEQDKATTADALNQEFEAGSDTVVPPEQKARDKERRHGVSEDSHSSAVAARRDISPGALNKREQQSLEILRTATSETRERALARAYLRQIGYSEGELARLGESKKSEIDTLLEAPDRGWPDNPSGQPQGTDAPWAPGRSFDHLPDVSPARPDGASVRPSWEELPDGAVKITINDPADLAELKEKVAAGDTSEDLFLNAIEHVLGNGLNLVRPELIGALTDSLILSDTPINEEDDARDAAGAKFWWYPNYQVRSPVEDLAEKGHVIFQSAGSETAKAPEALADEADQAAQRRLDPSPGTGERFNTP